MNVVRKKSIDAVTSSALTQPLEEQNDKRRGSQVSPLAAAHDLVTGRFAADIVGVAAELGLADQIQSGPKTAEEIAAAMGLYAPSLYRLLRALANFGVFIEQEDGRFGQTPISDTLRSDVPYSMRGMARMNFRPWTMRAWTELEHTVRTGTPAFEHAHGMQMFEYLTQHPEEMQIFVDAMRSFTVETGAAVSEAYDFSSIGTLADIGGSQGLVLSIILTKYPSLRGILFDLPIVIEGAPKFLKSRGVEHRVELRAGSFFESVPSGADAYLLKHILHDWSDADCVRILKTIQGAAKPGAKLLVVEAIVEDSSEPQFAKTLDIWMLAHLRGKERTRAEWQNLLSAGGFRLSRTIRTTSFASVIEAIRE
jgi:O-methyltransferase